MASRYHAILAMGKNTFSKSKLITSHVGLTVSLGLNVLAMEKNNVNRLNCARLVCSVADNCENNNI